MTVARAGALTTVQDLGRPGHRAAGVPLGGAADAVALRLANLAVGNDQGDAGLECTLTGPNLIFSNDAVIAVGGAAVEGLECYEPATVRAGTRVSLARLAGGCRAYLAIAGGIDAPLVLGSRSTDMRCGWGGHEGRALRAGDILAIGPPRRPPIRRLIDPIVIAPRRADGTVRVLRAAAWDECDGTLITGEYAMSPRSDRMGVRFTGPSLRPRVGSRPLSVAVTPGAIQVPPDGLPIVLLADAPTMGGYPVVAHVITADLPLVAQLRPGDRVMFREATLGDAHRLWTERERHLARMEEEVRHHAE